MRTITVIRNEILENRNNEQELTTKYLHSMNALHYQKAELMVEAVKEKLMGKKAYMNFRGKLREIEVLEASKNEVTCVLDIFTLSYKCKVRNVETGKVMEILISSILYDCFGNNNYVAVY